MIMMHQLGGLYDIENYIYSFKRFKQIRVLRYVVDEVDKVISRNTSWIGKIMHTDLLIIYLFTIYLLQ